MPRGKHLPNIIKEQIWNSRVVLGKEPDEIFTDLFGRDESKITVARIADICRDLDRNHTDVDKAIFEQAPTKRSGRKRKLGGLELAYMWNDDILVSPIYTVNLTEISLAVEVMRGLAIEQS